MLKLGGIDNRPPKADQAMGKFRVARNVYCTPDNRLIPRYDNAVSPLVGAVKCVHNISQYGDSVLSFYSNDPGIGYSYRFQKDGAVLPKSSAYGVSPFTTRTEDYPQQVQSLRNNNTQYYLCPYDGTMLKYDGVETSYTGVHQPIVYTSQVNFSGTKFLKVIQHRIDFDGTVPASESVSFSVLNTVTSLQLKTDNSINILNPALLTFATSVSEQIITPKVAGDVYYKETSVTYYLTFASLPATGTSGISYATITDNKWYFWNGAGYTLLSTLPFIATTAAGLPVIGAYDTVYRVTYPSSPIKYLRWQVNQRLTLVFANLAGFPVTGLINTRSYYAADTQLTYFWNGTSYVLAPNGGEYVELVSGGNYSSIQFENTTNKIHVCAGDSNITNENIGAYVIVISTDAGANVQYMGLPVTYLSDTIAYRIVSATSYGGVKAIVLDNASVKAYSNATLLWSDVSTNIANGFPLTDVAARNFLWDAGSRNVVTIWSSSSKEGVFFRKGTLFSFPDSSRYYYGFIDITTVGVSSGVVSFIPALTLNDNYDVNSAPVSANDNYDFGDIPLTSMSVYNGALLVSSDIVIWYTSPKKPIWFEMFNTKSFINVGSKEYGRITSICGTNEFFFVSRERKNYYITGNLSTGNYRVQNVTETETGAWGNTSTISIKDSVIFLTAKGIYQTVEGGRTSLVSDTCPKNFSTFDAMNVNEDVVFKVDGFHSNPLNGVTTDNSICVAYDEYRDLLAFMQKSEGNPCLILSTKTKEFYEWNGMLNSLDIKANCIAFIYSNYYLGGFTPATSTAGNFVESKGSSLAYITTYPVKLYTTWLTGGEPSLEKILLQLKIFGRIDSDASLYSIDVCHYKDWDLSTKITNSQYFPQNTSLSLNNQIQYSHKKRLNSDKVLSASVGIEVSKASISFEIESLEVEFLPIQQGMKR
jgi:hypothetical protein